MKKGKMMKMKDIIGDIVLIILANSEALAEIDVTKKTIYVKVLG